jgi:putative ABC transport system substrate-binding protein
MSSRRTFIRTLGLGVLAVHRHVHAQAPPKAAQIGYIGRSPAAQSAFVEGLRALGYVIGETVLVNARASQQNTIEEYSALTSQLLAAGVDVLLAANPQALEVMTKATKTIPIVGVDLESDPAAKGWVASLARPGGNVTGFFLDIPELSGKQLQLLKEVKPTLARVAVLGDRAVNELQFRAAEGAARGEELTLQPLPIKSPNEISRASKGAKPANLPVQRPTKFEFIVNLKTAKALSLQIPQGLLLRSDHVIR